MAYRSDAEAARALRESLLRDLEAVRAQVRELGDLEAREEDLKRRLADVDARLGAHKRSLLQTVKVATPCRARWEDMVGDEQVRFCGSCEKSVFNVSSMPEEEAERFLASHLDGRVCIRLYRRADGTVMTADCPEGVRKQRVRRVALAVVGGGMVAAAAAVSGALRSAIAPHAVMGDMASMVPAEPTAIRHEVTTEDVMAPEGYKVPIKPRAARPRTARAGFTMGAPAPASPDTDR